MKLRKITIPFAVAATVFAAGISAQAAQPNVIVVITDDQGLGDLGCSGNPIVKTPHIDRFHENAVRLTNYHVDTTCSPSRAALMTGRYSNRVGVWHTVQGRSLLRTRETTMADVFAENGYETGFFGKWHLGDNYPYRPEDRGFSHVVMHGGGGVGQTPDYWGNDYFNDVYCVNGEWKKFEGFCTDVWFGEAEKFIRRMKKGNKPFFAYISPNAPHGPLRAPQNYLDMYMDHPGLQEHKSRIPFYGMITNIDDRFGDLMKLLKEEGLEENTLVVFTTDNGTAGGNVIWDAGMRGGKGSVYEGGHRVPWFMRWPSGKLAGGRDVDQLTAHLDILPTFIDLFGLKAKPVDYDGVSVKDAIYGDTEILRDRTLMVETQRIKDPVKWRNAAVMDDRWRYAYENLYDLQNDPKQQNNLAGQYPEVVERLRAEYDKFWASVSADHDLFSRLTIGALEQNPTLLTSMDHITEGTKLPAWSQSGVCRGQAIDAPWMITASRSGSYQISIRRWPAESDLSIQAKRSNGDKHKWVKAYLEIGDIALTKIIPADAKEVTFTVDLEKGDLPLNTGFVSADGTRASANYAYVYLGGKKGWQTREGLGLPFVDIDAVRDYPKICDELGRKPGKK